MIARPARTSGGIDLWPITGAMIKRPAALNETSRKVCSFAVPNVIKSSNSNYLQYGSFVKTLIKLYADLSARTIRM